MAESKLSARNERLILGIDPGFGRMGYAVVTAAGNDLRLLVCDAIMTPRVSSITLGILSGRLAGAVSVSDLEVAEAIRFAWQRHQLVVEPGAAVGLAALLAGKIPPKEDTVVVLSGGNIDPALHARIVAT